MSLLSLPNNVMFDVISCGKLNATALANLRLTSPSIQDAVQDQLFSKFVLNLDNPACLRLIIHTTKIRNSNVIPDNDKDSSIAMPGSFIDSDSEDVGNDKADYSDFTTVAQYIQHLSITGTAREFPKLRRKVLELGVQPFISLLPKLHHLTFASTQIALTKPEWARLLSDVCPPSNSDLKENTTWNLTVNIEREYEESYDGLNSNLLVLHDVTSLNLRTDSWCKTNKTMRQANMDGIGHVLAHSPRLRQMHLSPGYLCRLQSDPILSAAPSEDVLPLEELVLDNVDLPIEPRNIRRLRNLKKITSLTPPRHATESSTSKEVKLQNAEVDWTSWMSDEGDDFNKTSILSKEDITCFWSQLKSNGIALISINLYELCLDFISYLETPSVIGQLRSLNLKELRAASSFESNNLAASFWPAIKPHGPHITHLTINPRYLGDWCWKPDSSTADALGSFIALKSLSIVPMAEYTGQLPPIYSSSIAWDKEYIESLLQQLARHTTLEELILHTASTNSERNSECGTGAVEYQDEMQRRYAQKIQEVVLDYPPRFVIKLPQWWDNGEPKGDVYEARPVNVKQWKWVRTRKARSLYTLW